MLFKNTTAEDVAELIGRNIILLSKEDSDLEISEDIDHTLQISFNKNISVSSNKLSVTNSVEISLTNLPLLIIYPTGLLFQLSLYPRIYVGNLRYKYQMFNAVDLNSLYIQNIDIRFTIDKSLYKATVIRQNTPILKMYFIPLWTYKAINPHVYFSKDTEYFNQLD